MMTNHPLAKLHVAKDRGLDNVESSTQTSSPLPPSLSPRIFSSLVELNYPPTS